MSTPTDREHPFRVRPTKPRRPKSQGTVAWSTALTTILRYARGTSSGKGTWGGRFVHSEDQRCAVRITYSRNTTPRQWRAHGRYIARESVTFDRRRAGFGADDHVADPASALDRWQSAGDPRLWKVILSPEFGERLDLERLTRELVGRMEVDLGTKLQWVAVVHRNTEHPHVHVAVRGIREDGTPLDLNRDYIRSGVRRRAEELCTNQLGYRSALDRLDSERGEIAARRFTSLDRTISRVAVAGERSGWSPVQPPRNSRATASLREQHVLARLAVLQTMGLAVSESAGHWQVRTDFEAVLRAMQKAADRQKMLAAHGAVLSDDRLQVTVLDWRKMRELEGRVLVHGEDDSGGGGGRHYLLLEGTDARVHMIYYNESLETARSQGKLRPHTFARLRKRFVNGRPEVEVDNLGSSEAILRDHKHLSAMARLFLKRGIQPGNDGWGGWLGRYQTAVVKAAEDLQRQSQTRNRNLEVER